MALSPAGIDTLASCLSLIPNGEFTSGPHCRAQSSPQIHSRYLRFLFKSERMVPAPAHEPVRPRPIPARSEERARERGGYIFAQNSALPTPPPALSSGEGETFLLTPDSAPSFPRSLS